MIFFFKRIVIFSFFSLATLIGTSTISLLSPPIEFRFFGNSKSGGHTWWRMKEFKESSKTTSYSVVHIGSSTCYRSINPAALQTTGIRSFNLGSSAQTILNSKYILEWALKYQDSITAVTLDLYPRLWSIEPTESTRDLFVNNPCVNELQFQELAWASSDIYNKILATYFGLKYTILPNYKIRNSDTDSYKNHGFTFSNRPALLHFSCDSAAHTLSRANEDALNSIIEICEINGINLIITLPPQLCDVTSTLPQSVSHLNLINGNNWPLAKVDSLYFDEHHLRGIGAELYSIWFKDQLKAAIK